jgi:hypothetical protein
MSLLVLIVGGVAGVILWNMFHKDEPAAPSAGDPDLRIEILNGCGSPGAADRVALLLRRAGYLVERTGNADHFHYRNDIVAARRVDLARVEPLGRILEGASVIEQRIPGYDVDVTVVVGKPRTLEAPEDED